MNARFAVVLTMFVLGACGGDSAQSGDRVGRLELRAGKSLEASPACGADLPGCEEGLSCISFTLNGAPATRCLESATLCEDLLTCTGGTECAVLESYPARVICAGSCEGDACDDTTSSGAP